VYDVLCDELAREDQARAPAPDADDDDDDDEG
jgi:hypothetical protein